MKHVDLQDAVGSPRHIPLIDLILSYRSYMIYICNSRVEITTTVLRSFLGEAHSEYHTGYLLMHRRATSATTFHALHCYFVQASDIIRAAS